MLCGLNDVVIMPDMSAINPVENYYCCCCGSCVVWHSQNDLQNQSDAGRH